MASYKVDIQPSMRGKEAVSVEMFLQYIFRSTDATIHCYIRDRDGVTIEVKPVYIPPEVYSEWTTDDQFLIDYVLSELKLSAVEKVVL